MTVSKKAVGTGITAREETLVRGGDGIGPEERQGLTELVQAASFNVLAEFQSMCQRIVGDLRERRLVAAKRMDAAVERVKGEATAETIEECEKAKAERNALYPLEDSEQWFAEKVLEHLGRADRDRNMGRHDEASRWDFQAGLTAGIASAKFEWESTTMTGAKVIVGGKAGHEKAHGTNKEKKERWDELQTAVDKAREKNPASSKVEIRRLVSKEKGVSDSTLRRHTTDSGKTKPAQSS